MRGDELGIGMGRTKFDRRDFRELTKMKFDIELGLVVWEGHKRRDVAYFKKFKMSILML